MKGMLSKPDLLSAFARMGISAGSHVMTHASLSSLGVVEDGARTVVDSLREAVGKGGAVITPSFRDAIRSDHYALRECAAGCSRSLCPSREAGFTGVIGETMREQPDALRSCHPTHSWVGIGEGARFLLEGHGRSQTPCGTDSPFFRLLQKDGLVLLLGVGVNSLTNMHAVEDALNVPYLSAIDAAHRHATYTTSGRRLQYVYPEVLSATLREAEVLFPHRVGASTSFIMRAQDFGSFLWIATAADPWCWVLRPRGAEYEPFDDACRKAAAMVRAWKKNPDRHAWQALLEESRKPRVPARFEPSENPRVRCPAYRGVLRGSHRCAANDIPPWEKFEDYPKQEPGVATCAQCNWPARNRRKR